MLLLLLLVMTAGISQPLKKRGSAKQSGIWQGFKYKTVNVDGLNIFYREAGNPSEPTIVLFHGFPSSSHMYQQLMEALSDSYHLVAPDYPGFGQSSMPTPAEYEYSFDNLSKTMNQFIEAIGLKKFIMYVHDYGGPVGFRIATQRPNLIQAVIVQNANAYIEGFGAATKDFQAYMENPGPETEKKIRSFLTLEGTKFQYLEGAEDPMKINPDSYTLDQYYLDRPGNDIIQLTLFRDYITNVNLYNKWHAYFREYQPPTLVISGQNDPIFRAVGAIAYKRDIKDAEIRLLNGGHFVLEEKHVEAATRIKKFLLRKGIK
jgi:pimeloyl-ACP methyl ester carboxylesterase